MRELRNMIWEVLLKLACDICRRSIGHDFRCPQCSPRKAIYYCSSCGEGIYVGEEYIENDNGEYKHFDCVYGTRDLLEWLGCEIKTMEDEYE